MRNRLFLLSLLGLQSACATTGATFRSGVGDTQLEHAPYYAGASMLSVAGDSGRVGHLPVAYQRGATQPVTFDPRDGAGTPIDQLLSDMNAFLDSLGISMRMLDVGRVSEVAHAATQHPPDVRFGCYPENGLFGNECDPPNDGALGRGSRPMLLAVGRPSPEWIEWTADVMRETGVSRTLLVTLEIGDYPTKQRGLLGHKVVELGTAHIASLPWLTSLETPVSVLQLTAVLVNPDGKAVRIGAEGFYARRTRLTISALGGQELIGDGDIVAARNARREDLPGQPLAWQVALRELVQRVTGRAASRYAPTAPH